MTIFVGFILACTAIGIWVVLRSGEREIELDKQDREIGLSSGKFEVLPHIKMTAPETEHVRQESWTLESVEDTSKDHEGE